MFKKSYTEKRNIAEENKKDAGCVREDVNIKGLRVVRKDGEASRTRNLTNDLIYVCYWVKDLTCIYHREQTRIKRGSKHPTLEDYSRVKED